MRRTRFVVAMSIAFAFCRAVHAQNAMNDVLVSRIKKATVFIQAGSGDGAATGTGFFVSRSGKVGLVATNWHVVSFDRERPVRKIEVVIGSGTPSEEVLSAEVVAGDPESDLALLRVEDAALPTPIELRGAAHPKETLRVFIAGFPLGRLLRTGQQRPNVTISSCAVSSIRSDKKNEVFRIQLDGEIHPGNSGGPVVDSLGKLIGIASMKVSNTNISFAVPAAKLEELMNGRVQKISFERTPKTDKLVILNASAELSDPMNKIRSVTVLLRRDAKAREIVERQKAPSRLPQGREYTLKIESGVATANIRLKCGKPGTYAYVYQVKYTVRGRKKPVYSPLEVLEVTFGESVADAKGDGARKTTVSKSGRKKLAENYGTPESTLDEEVKTPLPGAIEAVCAAGGGRYLVCKVRDVDGLLVYDAFQAKVARIIKLPTSDFIFAAGGNRAVVYLKDDNILQTWDLVTFERIRSKTSPFSGIIRGLIMGHSRGDMALARSAEGSEDYAASRLTLIDTDQLRPITQDNEIKNSGHLSGSGAQNRASGDLGYIAEWGTRGSPSGVGLYIRKGNGYEYRYRHDSAGALSVSDNGRVFGTAGMIYDSTLEPIGKAQGTAYFPALTGGLVLSVSQEGSIRICSGDKGMPLCQWGVFPGEKTQDKNWFQYTQSPIPACDRIVVNPLYGRAVLIPHEGNNIVLRPFDLKGTLANADIDYLVVTSMPDLSVRAGRPWAYQVAALSKAGGITYQLQMAPEGMSISKDGVITWTPRKDLGENGEQVILLLTDKSGVQTFHKFTLVGEG